MRELTGQLVRVWLGWTGFLAVLLLAGGVTWGFGSKWLFAAIVAGLVSIGIARRCARVWGQMASARWFWWR